MKNDKWLTEILSNLGYWQELPKAKFRFNPLYRVGTGRSTNLDFTFGTHRKFPLKNLRKLKYFSIEAPFPDDSVIFFQPTRQRLIVASESEGKVFKISTSEFQLALKDGEVKLLKHLEKSEFAPHTAKLLAEGSNWIVTSFCSNRDSLLNIPNVEEYLMEHMDYLIMGPMAKFYRAHELKKIKLSDYLAHAKVRASGHPGESTILNFISKLENVKEIELLHGQLHFDLHAGNILKDGNQVTIIDWEVTQPGLILVDYFDFYRRYLNKTKDQSPERLNTFHAKYQKWLRPFGVEATSAELSMKLYALERTLMYWDKWKQNRLNDKKSLEFKIINFVI